MNSARLWIVVSSVVWFVAGTVFGLIASGHWAPDEPEPSPIEHYTDRMISEFDLQGDRARYFRILMDKYQEEIDRAKEDHMARQASAMEPRLRDLGLKYKEHIKNHVLSEEQRAQFERLTAESF